jgi:fluoride ion exporter CrcB/FEX
MDNQIDHMPNHSIDYVLAFIGGFVGALSFFFKAHVSVNLSDLIDTIDYTELFNYALRSIIGGLIALIIKLLWDVMSKCLSRLFKKGGKHE